MTQASAELYLKAHYWYEDGNEIPWLNNAKYDGQITVVADAADYAVGARDDDSVEALADTKKVIVRPKNGNVSLEFRFRSDGATLDANIVKLFAAAGRDHYRLIDTITAPQGTQIFTGSIFFADAIDNTGSKWITSAYPVSSAGSIGSYVINGHSYDRFWFVASTLATTTLYIDWR